MKVGLIYATAHGSSAEIAAKIGEILKSRGLDVTVVSVEDVGTLESYNAFIFGSPVHSGMWLPELASFLKKSLPALRGKPVYFWVSCIRVLEPYGLQHVMENYMMPEILDQLYVRDKTAFAGKLDLSNVDWSERWTLAARYDGATWPNNFDGDFRNWEKIQTWANHVADDVLELQAK